MIQSIAIIGTPLALIIVAVVNGLWNWNINVTSLRRDEDEKRGQRILHLEERLSALEEQHRAELNSTTSRYETLVATEQAQRRRCESVIYALRNQVLILRGALVKAGIELPTVADIDY